MNRRRIASWLHRSSRGSTVLQHDRAARALVAAAEAADADAVGRMLQPDVELTVDGGGNVSAPNSPLRGAAEVRQYLSKALADPSVSLRVASVNGLPGVVLRRAGRVTGVLGIRVRSDLVVEAWLVVNPEKLVHWNAG